MIKIKLFMLVQLFVVFLSQVLAHDCLNNSNNFYCKLSTKTPYRFIANYNDSCLNYPGCTEKKIWMMIRHGTRFPGKKYIKPIINTLPEIQKKIIQNYKIKNSELSSETIKKFSKWKLTFGETDVMMLAEEGEDELIDLAERMQARFPTIFPEDYDEELYKFKHTATQRTEISAKSFALGLFGQYHSANISFPEPEHADPILRFYKRCQRWRIEVDKNPETYKEKDLFLQTEIYQNMLKTVSKRVGFEINSEWARLVYMMCAFETAWNKSPESPWCNLLSLDDITVLEYAEDLDYYWVDGHGFVINYEIACPAFRDMFSFFDSANKTKVTAYFTHSGTILKMLSKLGLARDEKPLTHDLFSFHKNRNWKVSLIDAFTSNIAFVLYDCKGEPNVLVLHQERVVQIPGCPDKAPCPLQKLKRMFPDTEEKCPFDDMCLIK